MSDPKPTLDEKLKLIIQGLPDPDGSISDGDMEDGIAQIKQAFQDEGYARQWMDDNTFATPRKVLEKLPTYNKPLMTGQEFYNRFEKEYHMRADWISADVEMGDDAEHDVLLAARLAAGLDET
jgi:hypothetical protein